MRLLILGGTKFVGRHIVESALRQGHEVTLIHRGQTGGELFEGLVHRVSGDRNSELDRLAGLEFDAVVDTCGYKPGQIRTSTEALQGSVGHYLFISTISVYDSKNSAESGPLSVHEPLFIDDLPIDGDTYGPLKSACESVLSDVWPRERTTILRPGFIVGPYDHTHRFPYWISRLDSENDVVAPAEDAPVQVVDGRDLADFALKCLADETNGTYNVVGPKERIEFSSFLEKMSEVCGFRGNLVRASSNELEAVEANLPIYVGTDPYDHRMMSIECESSLAQGLKLRPLESTIEDTLAWWRNNFAGKEPVAGWSREAEQSFLSGRGKLK